MLVGMGIGGCMDVCCIWILRMARFGCSRIQRRCESRTSWWQWVWQRMILSWDFKRPMCANIRALGWLSNCQGCGNAFFLERNRVFYEYDIPYVETSW